MVLTVSSQMFTMTADGPGAWEKDSDSSSSGIGTAEVTETVSNSSELDDDQTFLPTQNSTPSKDGSINGYHNQMRSYSTGSEQSWDGTGSTSSGNDHLSISSSPNLTPVKHDNLHLSNSYDSSVTKILDFHRSLAAYYNHGPKNVANKERHYYGSCEYLVPHRTHEKLNRAQDSNSGIPAAQLKSILRQNGRNHGNGSIDFTKMNSPTYENFPILPSKMKCIQFNLSTINENRDKSGTIKREVFSASDLKMGLNGSINGELSATQRRLSNSLDLITVDDHNSDGDNDDYGFLTYYGSSQIAYFSAAMQKAKSPSPAQRIFPKRWRRSKLGGSSSSSSSSPGGKPTSSKWKPQGGCIWSNLSGRRAMVPGTSLLQLSQIERLLLQKIALAKLQAMQLGCSISIPKDGASKRSKKPFSLKRKTNSEPSGSGWVFGIPLSKSVSNDEELRRRRPSQLKERRDSLDISHAIVRKSSSSSVSYGRSHSAECGGQDRTNLEVQSVERPVSFHAGAVSSDSLSETDTRSAASNLLDALSLSASSKLESSWREQKESLCPRAPQVPFIVKSCCQHLETYGLQVLGIFRIGCSKKRIRQLREEFDSGKDVKLNDEYNPHDVGGLLKEFFRDLPDPLLCRDLYSTFVATRKIADLDKRLHALRCLVALLPAANQDTLWTLVKFLALVTKHSTDSVDAEGNTIAGNKMDSHNLATLFAPSILHKAKGREFEVESVERARERREVIAVVKEIIDHHNHIFMLPSEMHDEILRVLHETNFEAADYILKRMPSSLGIDVDPETSSSFYEESDSSSIPRSPSSETECPRNITEALALRDRLAQKPAEPSLETLKVPQFRIISPDQGWYQPERSPSPVSPRISPSPKAMKQLSQPSPGSNPSPEHSPSSPAVLITPRPVRFRRTPMQTVVKAPSVRSSSIPIRDSRTLTVPTSMAERRGSDSSSSSYYPFSSRSPSHSPLSHDPPPSPNPSPRWYPETPPTTPSKEKDFKQLISSTHRPLGVTPSSHASEDHNSASGHLQVWQKERWKHWEKVAKERSSEFVEQETLV